jgi:hypothetical protein
MPVILPERTTVNVGQQAHHVLLEINGRVTEMPWEAAKDLATALRTMAAKAEEFQKAAGIAFDQAILLRSGAPFGLTDNPDIQAEAAKEAAWNSDLRRKMPGGVKSEEVLGTPVVRTGPPPGGNGHV